MTALYVSYITFEPKADLPHAKNEYSNRQMCTLLSHGMTLVVYKEL